MEENALLYSTVYDSAITIRLLKRHGHTCTFWKRRCLTQIRAFNRGKARFPKQCEPNHITIPHMEDRYIPVYIHKVYVYNHCAATFVRAAHTWLLPYAIPQCHGHEGEVNNPLKLPLDRRRAPMHNQSKRLKPIYHSFSTS